MNNKEIWISTWPPELHESEYAKKRIKSATSTKLTPISLDRENSLAIFSGSSKSNYTTTLNSCSCVDFIRNKKPCKHIYRLALELGFIEECISSYYEKKYSWEEVADIIESFCDEVQETFTSLIAHNKNYEVKSIKKKKNKDILLLLEKDVFVLEKETPQFVTIHLKEDFTPEVHSLYQYFRRKFNPPADYYLTDNLEEIAVYKPLADDSRTKRLIEKGFAYKTPDGIFIKGTL